MKRKYLTVSLLLISIIVSGCSLFGTYRTSIEQGRKINNATIAQLKPGLRKRQVIYLLGAPNVKNLFDKDSWYYVYTFEGNQIMYNYTLVLHFNQEGNLDQISGNYPSPSKLK